MKLTNAELRKEIKGWINQQDKLAFPDSCRDLEISRRIELLRGRLKDRQEALEEVSKIIDDLINRNYDGATLALLKHLIELEKIKELKE